MIINSHIQEAFFLNLDYPIIYTKNFCINVSNKLLVTIILWTTHFSECNPSNDMVPLTFNSHKCCIPNSSDLV